MLENSIAMQQTTIVMPQTTIVMSQSTVVMPESTNVMPQSAIAAPQNTIVVPQSTKTESVHSLPCTHYGVKVKSALTAVRSLPRHHCRALTAVHSLQRNKRCKGVWCTHYGASKKKLYDRLPAKTFNYTCFFSHAQQTPACQAGD